MTASSSFILSASRTATPTRAAWLAFVLLASGIFVADQASKWAAIGRLTDAMHDPAVAADSWAGMQRFLWREHPARTPSVTIHPDYFHLRYVENPGAAWGFLAGNASKWRTPFFLCISVGAIGFILSYFSRSRPDQWVLRMALGMVLGGAIGNFVDRIRLGYVIDFIDWHVGQFTWPTFNVADAGISVGVVLLLLTTLFEKSESDQAKKLSV